MNDRTHARSVLVAKNGDVTWTNRPLCGAKKGTPRTTDDLKKINCSRCRGMLRIRGDVPNPEEIDR